MIESNETIDSSREPVASGESSDALIDVPDAESEVRVERESLPAALEAILMVVEEPTRVEALAHAVGYPVIVVDEVLNCLVAEYSEQERGFELRELAGGWRFYSATEFDSIVTAFVLEGQQGRLSQAALETLAVVAYRQPISRSRISAIRGVNVDGVVRTLVTRGLLEELGHEAQSGAILYGTTSFFLERMGLSSIEDLPALAPLLPEIDDLDEELERVANTVKERESVSHDEQNKEATDQDQSSIDDSAGAADLD